MDVLSPDFFFFWGGGDFHGIPQLTNNTSKTSFGEDLVRIRPATAEQSHQKENTERSLKYMTLPSLAASGAV